MRSVFILCPAFLFSMLCAAQKQPSQAEINKMIKQGKQMAEQMKKNPEYEAIFKDVAGADEESTVTPKAPVKDVKRLAAIPATFTSKTALQDFVKSMSASLQQKSSATEKNKFESVVDKMEGNAQKLEDASIINWIKKSQKGALLLAMKAIQNNADDPMYVNNLAVLLIQAGRQEKAIPLLKYVLKSHPKSGMLLNNIGQAYFGLGDMTTARNYFENCLNLVPTHPEANHSMALIYHFMGNNAKAMMYYEQEMRVCYLQSTYDILKKNGRTTSQIFKLARTRWPEAANYFQQSGLQDFQVPKLPHSLAESKTLYPQHEAFKKKAMKEIEKLAAADQNLLQLQMQHPTNGNVYSSLVKNVFLENLQAEKEKTLSWINTDDNGETTYPTKGVASNKAGRAILTEYGKQHSRYQFSRRYEDSVITAKEIEELRAPNANEEAIRKKWDAKRLEVEIKYCQLETALAEQTLPKLADLQQQGFSARVNDFIPLINEAMFYSSLTPDDPLALMNAHNIIQQYISFLQAYSALTIFSSGKGEYYNGQDQIHVDCDVDALQAERAAIGDLDNASLNCPVKIVIPLLVAKVSYDCKKVEVEGGEGLLVGVEHEFKTGKTTLSVGGGIETNVPFVSAGAKQQVYVTFDGNGNYSDAGIKGEAGVQFGGAGPSVESKASYEIGLNAGASAKTEGLGTETPINF